MNELSESTNRDLPPAKRQKTETALPGSEELESAVENAKAFIAAALKESLAKVEEKAYEINSECCGKMQWCGEDHATAEQDLEQKTGEIESEFQSELDNAQDEYDCGLNEVNKREEDAKQALKAAQEAKVDTKEEEEEEEDPVAVHEETLEELREEKEELQREFEKAKTQAETTRDEALGEADNECRGKQQFAGEDHYQALRDAENAWSEATSELGDIRLEEALDQFEDAKQEALAKVEDSPAEIKSAMSSAVTAAQASIDKAAERAQFSAFSTETTTAASTTEVRVQAWSMSSIWVTPEEVAARASRPLVSDEA